MLSPDTLGEKLRERDSFSTPRYSGSCGDRARSVCEGLRTRGYFKLVVTKDVVLAGVGIAAGVLLAATTASPAHRATKVDPMCALREA